MLSIIKGGLFMKESISWIRLLIFQTILFFLNLFFISINDFSEITKSISTFILIFCFIIMYKLITEIEKKKFYKREKYCKRLNSEEEKYLNEVVELIKTVNSNIEIPKFNIYKIKLDFILSNNPAFTERSVNNKWTIYIKQNVFSYKDEVEIFMIILHEVLHTMHRTNEIFTDDFLEGLNQYLTIWLIKTYSRKHNIEKKINLIKKYYFSEVNLVGNILYKAKVDNYSVFINYIKGNLGKQFFCEVVKVPKEYLKCL